MRRFLAAISAVLLATTLVATVATVTASAATATGEPDQITDTTTTVEVPDSVERQTAKAISQQRATAQNNGQRFCFFGFGSCERADTDTGYHDCGGVLVDELGVSWNTNDGYETVHLVPTDEGRALIASIFLGPTAAAAATIAGAHSMYNDMQDCLDLHDWDVDVYSWSAMWQQLHCHLVFSLIGGGGSWDLEGHRHSHWATYLARLPLCNW